MRCRSPAPRRGEPRPSRSPVPRRLPRPASSSPVRQACDRRWSIPNPLLVAAVPDLGDRAGNHVEHLDAGNVGFAAITGGGRFVDDRDVLAVVTRGEILSSHKAPCRALNEPLKSIL